MSAGAREQVRQHDGVDYAGMDPTEQLPHPNAVEYANCLPCPFSTDDWRRPTVWALRSRLNRQVTPPEQSAALVLGPGGFPFLWGDLQVARAVIADLNEKEVIGTAMARFAMLWDHESWASYGEASFAENPFRLSANTLHYSNPRKEFERARRSGLMRDYAVTRDHAGHTKVEGLVGNILKTAPELAQQLEATDQVLTFVNFTNVADYCAGIDAGHLVGQRMLREQVLDVVPVANDLIIVDSAPDLRPRLHSLATYGIQ